MNGSLKRPYSKLYAASPMTHVVNSDGHVTGKPIRPGTVVTVVAHYGPFRRIRDEAGNEMSVGRYSLVPVPKGLDQLKVKAQEQATLRRYWYVVLVDALGSAQVVHKDDADRSMGIHPGSYFVVFEAHPFNPERSQ